MSGAQKVPAVNVTVGDTTYPAGQPLPDGVAELITNPKVWEAPEEAEVPDTAVDEVEPEADDEVDAEASSPKPSRARK